MMTRYSLIRRGLAIVGLAVVLAGCNGKEDFSDAVVSGDPLGSGAGGGANFNALDACAPRVIGALVDAGTVKNVRYQCDGFFGYTGETGLSREVEQNFFVCPLGATSVTFLLGGRENNVSLGTAYFRRATSKNLNSGCDYDETIESYAIGQYDADGIYLFSPSDLVEGPARIDATSEGNEDSNKARNISALLQGLDTAPGDETISIDVAAHDVFVTGGYVFPDESIFDSTYEVFAPVAQNYLDRVAQDGAVGSLPTDSGINLAISRGNNVTAAGLYRFELETPVHWLLNVSNPDFFADEVVVSDSIRLNISAAAINPDTLEVDPVLPLAIDEFWPVVMATRRGGLLMGGPLDVIDVNGSNSEFISYCTDGVPDYASLSNADSFFSPTLAFSDFVMSHTDAPSSSLTLSGRVIGGYTFNGLSQDDTSETDYTNVYRSLPEEAHVFDPVTDKTTLSGTFCGRAISAQPVLSVIKSGAVTPYLDTEVMSALAATPMRYTLQYKARALADDDEPDTTTLESVPVTIHEDGSIFTDLYGGSGSPGGDGNPGYVADGPVPASEFEIGMVSSVFRSDLAPEDASQAMINILVYNFAGITESGDLPQFGSHFRARLKPDLTSTCENTLFAASDSFGLRDDNLDEEPDKAYWFDTYATVEAFKQFPSDTDAHRAGLYDALRKRAYGYIEAVRTDCP